ncbi:hypothetical protein ACFL2U_02275 [Patescibacteria group bacterium]
MLGIKKQQVAKKNNNHLAKVFAKKLRSAERRLLNGTKCSKQTKINAVNDLDDLIHISLRNKANTKLWKLHKQAIKVLKEVAQMAPGEIAQDVRSNARNILFTVTIEKNL